MPTEKIPLTTSVDKISDEVELNRIGKTLIDAFQTKTEGIKKRFGLIGVTNVPPNKPGHGLFWWPYNNRLIAINNGEIYKIEKTTLAYVVTNVTGVGAGLVDYVPVTFASDGIKLFFANGGRIVYFDETVTPTTIVIADADCPTQVTHVDFLDDYLLANSVGSNKIYFSDVGNPTSWSALSFFSVSGKADYVTAFKVRNREIYLWGPESFEIWENNGKDPFSRVPGGYYGIGISAPYSVIVRHDLVWWLSDNRSFVQFDGSTIQKISTPYDKEISNFASVADCVGQYVKVEGFEFLKFDFKSANRTLIYNLETQTWSEFARYMPATGTYDAFLGSFFAYVPEWNLSLFQSRLDYNIYAGSFSAFNDIGSEKIRVAHVSGHIDHGSSKKKDAQEIRFRARRGEADVTNPKLMLRWRDNGGDWKQEHRLSLGNLSNTEMILRRRGLGSYRTRQYEISVSDNVPVTILDAEEDFQVLF